VYPNRGRVAETFPTGETNMLLQNRRRAAGLAAHLSKTARVACALAGVALLSAMLLACAGSRGLTDSAYVSAAQERFEGQWLVEYKTDEGKTSLTLRHRESKRDADGRRHAGEWNTTRNIDPTILRGLTREQALSNEGTNVRFDIRREAGTFACEGWFKRGSGSGHFTFVPEQGFAAELSRRGVGTPNVRQLFSLALEDVGLALLDELNTQGYERPNVEQLVRMGEHDVTAEYVRGMGAAGYRLRSIETLVKMRDHDVTPEYVRELRQYGYADIAAEELLRARDHDITSEFISELQGAGYKSASLEGLIRVRDHDVDADYIKALRDAGYTSLALEELVRMRDHDVTSEFVVELKGLGYTRLSSDQLVRMRDHDVTTDFIRRVISRRSAAPTVEELIDLKNHDSY
jgi:hypothetical protein